jgi:hypothetical protein
MPYSNEEYLDMVLLYGERNQNAAAAAEEYAARFPNRRRPNPHVILRLISRARHTGCWSTRYSKSPCNGRSNTGATGGCRTRP